MGMEKDIVCERAVSTDTPFMTKHGDRPYYFCSRKCEMDFAGNPLRYVDKSRSASSCAGSPRINEEGHEVQSKI